MTALELALAAKRAGASFAYDADGQIQIHDATRLPLALQADLFRHLDDVRAVVSEFSVPAQPSAVNVVDTACRLVREQREGEGCIASL